MKFGGGSAATHRLIVVAGAFAILLSSFAHSCSKSMSRAPMPGGGSSRVDDAEPRRHRRKYCLRRSRCAFHTAGLSEFIDETATGSAGAGAPAHPGLKATELGSTTSESRAEHASDRFGAMSASEDGHDIY